MTNLTQPQLYELALARIDARIIRKARNFRRYARRMRRIYPRWGKRVEELV